jgi:hypothetical protein
LTDLRDFDCDSELQTGVWHSLAMVDLCEDGFIPITSKLAAIGDNQTLPPIAPANLGAAGGPVAPERVPVPPEIDEFDQKITQ